VPSDMKRTDSQKIRWKRLRYELRVKREKRRKKRRIWMVERLKIKALFVDDRGLRKRYRLPGVRWTKSRCGSPARPEGRTLSDTHGHRQVHGSAALSRLKLTSFTEMITLMMEAGSISVTTPKFYRTTERKNPENSRLNFSTFKLSSRKV
jgi:hypothetical protein